MRTFNEQRLKLWDCSMYTPCLKTMKLFDIQCSKLELFNVQCSKLWNCSVKCSKPGKLPIYSIKCSTLRNCSMFKLAVQYSIFKTIVRNWFDVKFSKL